MREAAVVTFSFKYVNRLGVPDSFIPRSGRVTRDGLILEDGRIFFRDIHRVERHHKSIVVVLKPGATISREISNHIFKGFTTFLINIGGFARQVQSIINRRVSMARLNDRKMEMDEEEVSTRFVKADCPNCDAAIDLIDVVRSHYIYCEYCGAIFDHYGYLVPGGDSYRVCPETGYYERVRDYWQHTFYVTRHEFAFKSRKLFCSDTYVHMVFEKVFVKNLTLLFGAFLAGYEKIKSLSGRDPNYIELVDANLAAHKGDMEKALFEYAKLVTRNKYHPGLHMNLGLIHLKNGNERKALVEFKRSLDNCSNYTPVIEILRKFSGPSSSDE
ncbi:tetratricopeptide repeat protein [Chondrinema litorale]|uniref:tetratricopeptide repeat protein n=1 Tax=Chondrinema litorale TaxID=2994555 RepID=UPI002542AF2D|nr:hypothetical protein [Chondrinema litorale]UZR95085.1 hypothetical protein OQ292_04550 [Chondrinema litorale]